MDEQQSWDTIRPILPNTDFGWRKWHSNEFHKQMSATSEHTSNHRTQISCLRRFWILISSTGLILYHWQFCPCLSINLNIRVILRNFQRPICLGFTIKFLFKKSRVGTRYIYICVYIYIYTHTHTHPPIILMVTLS